MKTGQRFLLPRHAPEAVLGFGETGTHLEFQSLQSGTSVEGRPIEAYRSDVDSSRYVYLMAGVHGDEVEGIFALERLFEWLKSQGGFSWPLVVVPVLNVDGYKALTRVNANGVDLNRNLASGNWQEVERSEKYRPGPRPMSEPENVFLDSLFQAHLPGFILTLHSWKPLLNYNGDCKDVAEFLETYNDYPVCPDTEGHPTPGSLGEYAPSRYGCPVLTYEFPLQASGKSLPEIWAENEKGLRELFLSEVLRRFVHG